MHIILACNLPVLVISSWWLPFYQSGVAFLHCFWHATILAHCSWPKDVFLRLCFLWFISPSVLAESSHQITPLETRRLYETPNICIHIPHGDSALNPTTRDFKSFTSNWFLLACTCGVSNFHFFPTSAFIPSFLTSGSPALLKPCRCPIKNGRPS